MPPLRSHPAKASAPAQSLMLAPLLHLPIPGAIPAAVWPMICCCRCLGLCCLKPFLSLQFSHWFMCSHSSCLTSTCRVGGTSLCSWTVTAHTAYQNLWCLPAVTEKKNPRKTAKLLWPFSLHKATVHFSNQMLPSNIKKCFCKWHTSSRNRNSELQPLFAWVQRHLEHSNCWIPVWRKRIPWLSVSLLHSVRTAKNKPPAKDHWILIMHRFPYHFLSSTRYWWHLHLNYMVQRHPTDKGATTQ